MVDKLYRLFLQLFDAAVEKNDNVFKNTMSNFNSWYKKASISEQGEYHYLVSLFMKD